VSRRIKLYSNGGVSFAIFGTGDGVIRLLVGTGQLVWFYEGLRKTNNAHLCMQDFIVLTDEVSTSETVTTSHAVELISWQVMLVLSEVPIATNNILQLLTALQASASPYCYQWQC
jgi:hypothetical protein